MAQKYLCRVLSYFAWILGGLTFWSAQQEAHAMAVDWNGNYRIEYVDVDRTEMTAGSRKSYLLSNLVLQPRIYATDGFEIVSRLHLTANNDNRYKDSQMGMIWGNAHTGTDHFGNSNALGQNRPQTSLSMSQMYLKIDQEWGQLILGRAPMQFGLGIHHNAGQDPFSHWYDTRDMLAYRIQFDNFVVTPMISKNYANDFAQGDEATTKSFLIDYKNADNQDWLGFLYESTQGSSGSNDIPLGNALNGGFDMSSYNLILGKKFDAFSFKIEGAFLKGSTGKTDTVSGEKLDINSLAMVGEFDINTEKDRNYWKIKVGSVSGDNPNTPDFEGFFLDRNYEVALLLFNHPLGEGVDIFKTANGRSLPTASFKTAADDEIASNVIFIAPQWTHQLAEHWNIRNTLAFARLNNTSIDIGGGTIEDIDGNVGVEWDLGFSYKTSSNFEWKIDSGVLLPGKAFALGSANKSTSTVIGIVSAAAITF